VGPKVPLPPWTADLDPIQGSEVFAVDRLPVWSFAVKLTPWAGSEVLETDRNKNVHCGKGAALVRGPDGSLSCGEVELTRRLRNAKWLEAGWVQAWVCGRLSWQAWIMPLHSETGRLRDRHGLNLDQVAQFRGLSDKAVLGHPDVIAWRGDQTVFIEFKGLLDPGLKETQVQWFKAASRLGLVSAANYVIVDQKLAR
jgi:hypothetical protein